MINFFLYKMFYIPQIDWDKEILNPIPIETIKDWTIKAKRAKTIIDCTSWILLLTCIVVLVIAITTSNQFPVWAAIICIIGSLIASFLVEAEEEVDKLISKLELINTHSIKYQWLGLLSVSRDAQQFNCKLKNIGRLPMVGEVQFLTEKAYANENFT